MICALPVGVFDMVTRFSILCGVSTSEQAAEDKDSIQSQIATCRRVIKQFDGIEMTDPFVMDGFSRSGYDSLPDAMRDIPPLKAAIEAAANNQYDVLIMDNWDRLGDLGLLVNTRFKRYKKQLYSARQSGRLQDPDDYNPNLDESAVLNMHLQGIIQSYRIQKLQRGLQLGVQKRVEDGKYSINFPTGYSKDNEWHEPTAALLVQLKDDLLRGAKLGDLAATANASGIKTGKGKSWNTSTIHRILKNPFYAGKVFYKRYRTTKKTITKNGKRSFQVKQNPDYKVYDGNHRALWTWDEHLRILEEFEERYKKMPRHNPQNFSGLLVCDTCGDTLRMYNGKYTCYPAHDGFRPIIKSADANRLIGLALAAALKDYGDEMPEQQTQDNHDASAAIDREIAKVQDLAIKEVFTANEAKDKIASLRKQKAFIESTQTNVERRVLAHERIKQERDKLMPYVDTIPDVLANEPKANNNRFLRDILREIRVKGENDFLFIWRI
jgi:hypothetical protein